MIHYKDSAPWLRPLFQIAIWVAVFFVVYYLRSIVIYFLVAAVLTLVGRPLYRFYRRLRIGSRVWVPASMASALTLLSLLSVLGLLVWLLAPMVKEQVMAIADVDPQALAHSLDGPLASLSHTFGSWGLNPDTLATELKESLQHGAKSLLSSDFFGSLGSLAGNLGNLVMGLFAVLFMSFFFLKSPGTLHRVFTTLVPDRENEKMAQAINDVKPLLRRYFMGLMAQSAIVSTLLTTGLAILGFENALLMGLFGGIINLIPYLGPWLGAGVGILFYITTHASMPEVLFTGILLIAAVFLVVQLIDNFFIQPYLFSTSVKAHPLEIFIVILIGGQLGGIGGMIAAIPTYTTVRALAKAFYPHNRFVRALTVMEAPTDEPDATEPLTGGTPPAGQ